MAKLGKMRSINEFDLESHRSFALNASLDIFIFKMHFPTGFVRSPEFQVVVPFHGFFKSVELVSICLELRMVMGPNWRDFPAGHITCAT